MNENFLLVFRRFIKFYRDNEDPEDIKEPETVDIYNVKYLKLTEYLQLNDLLKIKVQHVTISFVKGYMKHLLDAGFKRNSAVRYTTICSQVLTWAANQEIIRHNPIIALKLKKLRPPKPPYYTPEQIQLWENFTSTSIEETKTAHLVVLQIHTGFDIGDFKEITREHKTIFDGNKYLVKNRHKNRRKNPALAIIPLADRAEEVLELYNYNMNLISFWKYNKFMKIIAAKLGLPADISSKDMRKIYVMKRLNNDLFTMEATSRTAGHQSVRTTETYYGTINMHRVNAEVNEKKK